MTYREGVVFSFAAAAGLFLAYEDRHTDDTGIIAGLLFSASFALSIYAPRREIFVALLVGLPLVLPALVAGGWSMLAALAFPLAGAFGARFARRLFAEAFPSKS